MFLNELPPTLSGPPNHHTPDHALGGACVDNSDFFGELYILRKTSRRPSKTAIILLSRDSPVTPGFQRASAHIRRIPLDPAKWLRRRFLTLWMKPTSSALYSNSYMSTLQTVYSYSMRHQYIAASEYSSRREWDVEANAFFWKMLATFPATAMHPNEGIINIAQSLDSNSIVQRPVTMNDGSESVGLCFGVPQASLRGAEERALVYPMKDILPQVREYCPPHHSQIAFCMLTWKFGAEVCLLLCTCVGRLIAPKQDGPGPSWKDHLHFNCY